MSGARLVSADWVVPIATPPLPDAAVLLEGDGTVRAVGPRRALLGQAPEEHVEGALLPGLVNAHTHLELSHLGLLAGGAGLPAWAGAVMARGNAAGETAAQGALAAARQAVAQGTAAVGDVGNGLAAVPAIGEAGLVGAFFHELLGSREARTGDAVADATRERQAQLRRHAWPARLTYGLAPHAPYSVGADLFRRIFALRALTSVHVAEDPAELALLLHGEGPWAALLERLGVPAGSRSPGMSPVTYLASLGAFQGPQPPLLVHMVHASSDDRALARRFNAPVVLCPRSNLHIGGQLPDVPALLAEGLVLALGTDSLASSPDLGLWGEMQALARAFPAIAPSVWLTAATAGGAKALGLPALGTLTPGARPGLLRAALPPGGDPLASLVHTPPPLQWMAHA
jgi:cytosine/adenosine deaminase-related metal-dependent hydrolase